jgi:DNA replication protein DnaC
VNYSLADLSPIKRHWLIRSSNIPSRFIGIGRERIISDLGSYPKQIDSWIDMVNEGLVIKKVGGLGTTGVGILMDGSPGLGKTTHAVSVLQELIRALPDDDAEARKILHYIGDDYGLAARPIYYLTFPEFMARKKALIDASEDERQELNREMDGFHGRAKEDWLNVRVLVLDDLGKEYGSKYTDASFDEILRSRYDKGLPTIITTNVRLEDWGDKYSQAMESFAHEAFVRLSIKGNDLRTGS